MNLVLMQGTLADEPKLYHESKKHPPMCLLDIRSRNPRTGKHIDWHKIVSYGKLAIAAAEHLHKDMKIVIVGQIEWRQWKSPEGKYRKRPQIIARSISLQFHQWSSSWLELALHLASQEQQSVFDEPVEKLIDEEKEEKES